MLSPVIQSEKQSIWPLRESDTHAFVVFLSFDQAHAARTSNRGIAHDGGRVDLIWLIDTVLALVETQHHWPRRAHRSPFSFWS